MRILWIHQYFATLQGWGSARTFETAVRWAQAGHAVDILCTPAYDPSLAGRCEVAVVPGARVFVSRVRYSPHMGFAARCFVRRFGGDYDIAIGSSAPLSAAIPALPGRSGSRCTRSQCSRAAASAGARSAIAFSGRTYACSPDRPSAWPTPNA